MAKLERGWFFALAALVVFLLSQAGVGRAADCNANLREDESDIAGALSADCNRNGVPDECEVLPASASYVQAVEFPADGPSLDMKGGDLDADGSLDLALLLASEVLILENDASRFTRGERFPADRTPAMLEMGDLDRDGDLDLLTLNQGFPRLSLHRNDGSGVFPVIERFATHPEARAGSDLALADLDGDQDLDIAVASAETAAVSLSVNDGVGLFAATRQLTTDLTQTGILTADLDNDGDPDVALSGPQRTWILRNDGGLTFAPGGELPDSGTSPASLLASDMNGDRRPDVSAFTFSSSAVVTFLNQPSGDYAWTGGVHADPSPSRLASADIDGDGHNDIVVLNSPPFAEMGLGMVTVFWNQGQGSLLYPRVRFVAGQDPSALVVADADGDGALDFLTANSRSQTVSLIRNRGARSFMAVTEIVTGNAAVAAGDLDGENGQDLIIAGKGTDNRITLLRNSGQGGFHHAGGMGLTEAPGHAVTGDFDADGKLDLITGPAVFLNRGDWTFSGPGFSEEIVTTPALGDLNGDAYLDVAVGDPVEKAVVVLLNNGSGRFIPRSTLGLGAAPQSVHIVDLNGDGAGDVVAVQTNTVSVLIGLGSRGMFEPRIDLSIATAQHPIFSEDLDRDARQEVVVATELGFSVIWYDGQAFYVDDFYASPGTQSIEARDLDRDGFVDLELRTCRGRVVARNLGRRRDFQVLAAVPDGDRLAGHPVTVSDLDGDETPDFAGPSLLASDKSLDIYFSRSGAGAALDCNLNAVPDECEAGDACAGGVGRECESSGEARFFTMPRIHEFVRSIDTTVAVDLTGDGRVDIAGLQFQELVVLSGRGDGRFAFRSRAYTLRARGLAAADLDGDGDQDLAFGKGNEQSLQEPGSVQVFRNQGDGELLEDLPVPAGVQPSAVAEGDMNGDGHVDLAVANSGSKDVLVLANDGHGGLAAGEPVVIGLSTGDMESADLEGDGDLDLVVLGLSAVVLVNDGTGTFAQPLLIPAGNGPGAMVIRDLDGDSDPDLAVAGGEATVVLLNRGDGSFDSRSHSPGGGAIAALDADHDNDPDLILVQDTDYESCSPRFVGSMSLSLNDGSGQFQPLEGPGLLHVPRTAAGLTAGDLNGDGLEDLVVGASNAPLSVILAREIAPPDDCRSPFHRGDANGDASMNIADAVGVLGFLFLGDSRPLCLEAADANNDGAVNIADPVGILTYLFLGGVTIPHPGPIGSDCGEDPDPPGSARDLGCAAYAPCSG